MPPKKSKKSKAKASKGRSRKQRKPGMGMTVGYKGLNKSYSYNFTPGTQFVSNQGVGAANAVNVSPTTLSGPIALGSPFVKVSASLIPGYSDVGVAMPFSLLDVANYTVFSSVYD